MSGRDGGKVKRRVETISDLLTLVSENEEFTKRGKEMEKSAAVF
jgi:hypothetical protein